MSIFYVPQFKTTSLNVGGGIDDSQTTGIVIQSVTGVDITKPGIICISWADPLDTGTAEWISYTSIDGSNELQGVVRGAEDSTARAHSNGAVVAFPISKSHINNLNDALAAIPTAVKDAAFEFIIDGGGVAITTGIKGDLEVPFACTIVRATLLADQSGSIVVDVWKDSYANFAPTDADSITASAPPTITTATNSQDTTLTGWTKSLAKGDILRFNVDSCTSITRATLSLLVEKA